MRALTVFACAIALTAFLAPGARADEWNKLTYLTFSAPVQLPGITLPAGTYAFKLADSWSNRHIVQVFDKQQTKVFGTFLTVSDQKLDPSSKPVVLFSESAAHTPRAVRAWFYPGDTTGDEFVYSKRQAVEIAKNAHQAVMATDEDTAGNDVSKMKSARVGHVNENGTMSEDNEDNRANSTASGTTGAYTASPKESNHRSGVAENSDTMNRYENRRTNPSMAAGGETVTSGSQVGTTAQRRADRNAATGTSGQTGTTAPRRHLPQTASSMSFMELLSALSLAGACGLGQIRRRFGVR